MKKIFLLLFILSSFAWSALPSSFSYDGHTYVKYTGPYNGYDTYTKINPQDPLSALEQSSVGTAVFKNALGFSTPPVSIIVFAGTKGATVSTGFGDQTYYTFEEQSYNLDDSFISTPTCTSTQELIDNVCVEKCPSGQERYNGECVEKCDQVASQFRTDIGTCQDCMTFTSFSGRSSCACNSQNSTYTPQGVMSTSVNIGKYTYKKTNITCDNGTRISIYHDPINTSPNDYNKTYDNGSALPVESNSTTPLETNTSTTPTTSDVAETIKSSNDKISQALKSIETGQKDATTALTAVGVDVKEMNTQLAKQGTTFNEILTQIKTNGTESQKSNQILGDVNTGLTQFKNKFGAWVDQDQINSNAQVSATNGVKGAVDSASTAITDKLGDVINAIKDSNGTGKEIDLNTTNAKLDTLHDDNNKTQGILEKISGFFDTNGSIPDINTSGETFVLSDLLPDNTWFDSNKLNLNLNNYKGACYLETTTFIIYGKSFVFPPPELIAMIPFSIISNLMMALLFILGLRDFLRS